MNVAALWAAGGYSILFYLVSVLVVYVGCLTFHAPVSFTSLLTAVPVLLILFMIPFSFGGIGLSGMGLLFCAGSRWCPRCRRLESGLLFRARSIGFGLIGGMFYPFISRVGSLRDPIAEPAK